MLHYILKTHYTDILYINHKMTVHSWNYSGHMIHSNQPLLYSSLDQLPDLQVSGQLFRVTESQLPLRNIQEEAFH